MPDTPRERQQHDDLPSIPDGGLSDSMPDWLRRPPAWRTLPDRDVVAPDPTPGTTANLPEADTSVIDPRTFMCLDDLPGWLQAFPASGESRSGKASPDPDPARMDHPGRDDSGTTQPAVAFRPRRPQLPVVTRASVRPATASVRPRSSVESPWWEGAAFTLVLGIALVVAVIVIIMLALT